MTVLGNAHVTGFLSSIELPPRWGATAGGQWTMVVPPRADLPLQGWKYHVSATLANAEAVLDVAARICFRRSTAFKFLRDDGVLRASLAKSWQRSGAGKFVTIYPTGPDDFMELGELLYEGLRGFEGPYILSDRRYRDARVLYYRYGGIHPNQRVRVDGSLESVLVAPDGRLVPDQRLPYFTPPPWVTDPYSTLGADDTAPTLSLAAGRYQVERALHFSVTGGVYLARDRTGGRVVVKEARPFTMMLDDETDAVALLRNEHRVLERIAAYGVAPAPVDLFTDWEHTFLVTDYIAGTKVTPLLSKHHPILRREPTKPMVKRYVNRIYRIFRQVLEHVDLLHSLGIVIGDISPNNLVIERRTGRVYLLDFEGASLDGDDRTARLYTPGFASKSRYEGRPAEAADDVYGLASLLAYLLWPATTNIDDPEAFRGQMLGMLLDDLAIASPLADAALHILTAPRGCELASLRSAAARRNRYGAPFVATQATDPKLVAGVGVHISDECARRSGREGHLLLPLDKRSGDCPVVSVSYGLAGVVHGLVSASLPVPPALEHAVRTAEPDENLHAPGLWSGLAGLAWVLSGLGEEERAIEVADAALRHPILGEVSDFAYGNAGVGSAALHLFIEFGDRRLLDHAARLGDRISASATSSGGETYWSSGDGVRHIGLAQGGSGIALFLTDLATATGEDSYLRTAADALAGDLAHGITDADGALSFPAQAGKSRVRLPYLSAGSAGVGAAMIRHLAAGGDVERFGGPAAAVAADLVRKYAVRPGLFSGVAGLGSTLLDYFQFTGEAKYREQASLVAGGLALYASRAEDAVTFPGDDIGSPRCDYATGSAGIAALLHRLNTSGPNRNFIPGAVDNAAFPLIRLSGQ
jgi:tRNA A-37 threonylcarbamoyl transferase component Bud32